MTEVSRIKPPMGHDNAWWWEMAAQNKLAIQRCTQCQTLRHPPVPVCEQCHSLEWDSIESSGQGTICSYTVLTHPQFPGYDYPLIIVLIDLEEGVRITSSLIHCEPADVDFGLAVRMEMHEDPDGFKLPMFCLVGES